MHYLQDMTTAMEREYFLKFSLAFESIFSKHTPKLNLTGIEVLNVQLIIIELLQWNKDD